MASTADRVRDLIRMSGRNQRVFATEVGLDDSKLSKSLAGSRRFTSSELARIAELCHVTVDWLISGDEPELATAARSAGGVAAQALAEARRLSAFRSDVAFLGHPQPWRPLPASSADSGAYAEQGARLAAAAVAAIVATGRRADEADLAGLIEDVFGADVAVTELGADFDGLAVSSDDVKLVLAATSTLPARQRFTLAHELGHLLAGDDQQVHMDEDVLAGARRRDPSEVRANAFAAAFLMPEPVLRDAIGTDGLDEGRFAVLALDLGVSPSALAVRLKSLRLIDAGACDRWRVISAQRAAQLADRVDELARRTATASSPRLPALLVRDTYRAYESGDATLRPYAALIGADVDRLRAALESDTQVIVLP